MHGTLSRAPKEGTTALDSYVRKSLLLATVRQDDILEAVLTLDLNLPLMIELFTDG